MNIDKSNSRKFVAILFLIVIFFYMLNIFTIFYKNDLFKDISRIESFVKKVDSIKSRIDKYCTESINFRTKFIELNSFIKAKSGMKYIYDTNGSVIKMENGYLTYYYDNLNIKSRAKKIIELSKYIKNLDNNKIDFLYVQAPFKINKYDNQLAYDVDYSNIMADNLLIELKKSRIDTWDIRDEFASHRLDNDKDNINYYERFYKTDHHWKVETGLEVANKLSRLLNEKYNFSINTNLFDRSNYEVITYKNWFLGSQGKKVSLGFVKPEDFNLVLPKFETNLTLDIPSKKINNSGDFKDTLINFKLLNDIDYYNISPYAAYLYNDNPVSLIYNSNIKDNKKVLLIKDSFSLAMAPFLALGIKDLRLIDARYYKDSIQTYIKDFNPDIVIIMYNPSTFRIADAFDFN